MRKIWVIALIFLLSGCSLSSDKPMEVNATISSTKDISAETVINSPDSILVNDSIDQEQSNVEDKSVELASSITTQSPEEGEWYAGAIGNMEIHAIFSFSGDKVSGTYYYDKYKKNIDLSGYIDYSIKDVSTFEVIEDTPDKGIMHFIVRSPEYIQGIWRNDEKSYLIYLIREGAKIVPPKLSKDNSLRFEGHWTGENSNYFCGSQADIKVLSDDLLYYELFAHNGVNQGSLIGFALIVGNSAKTVFTETTSDENKENIVFKFSVVNNNLIINSNNYDFQCGFAVNFDSSYSRGKVDISTPTALQVGIVSTEDQDDIFRKLVGDKYYDFIQYTQYVNFDDYNLDGENVKVCISYLRGSSGYCIYIRSSKLMYAAILGDDNIEYFTNDKRYAEMLPQPIADWAKDKDMAVEYNYK